MRVLSAIGRFQIWHEYEEVFAVDHASGRRISLGSHYGDPDCALVTEDERWIIVTGEGITAREVEGQLYELFRDGALPEPGILAGASTPDQEYPGNPFPDQLYPVEIVVIEQCAPAELTVRATPPLHLPSTWLLSFRSGIPTVSPLWENTSDREAT